jgi:hypothetical protein
MSFDAALGKLGLVDRTDPIAMEVAKSIIEFAKQGERDPERLCALTLQAAVKVDRHARSSLARPFPLSSAGALTKSALEQRSI